MCARVLILSVGANRWHRSAYEAFLSRAKEASPLKHTLTETPTEADCILFVEIGGQGPYMEHIRCHPYFKRYQEKCFLFAATHHAVPFIPGYYTSIEKSWHNPRRLKSGFYIGGSINTEIRHIPWEPKPNYLFSFVGTADNHPVRKKIMKLSHPGAYLEDTSGRVIPTILEGNNEKLKALYESFALKLGESQFVLCPRGDECSSIRLFETMQTGRVPVIISDDWIPPEEPDWKSFSIRVSESEVPRIPEILETHTKDAQALGEQARAEWLRCYGPQNAFNTVVDGCLELKERRRYPEWLSYRLAFLHLLKPFHIRNYLRTRLWVQKLKKR